MPIKGTIISMGKLTFIALVAIVIGIVGGVIEVQFHADKLASLPGNLARVTADGSLLEKGRILATRLKREGEFWIIRDEQQRLEIATKYVESDAKHLNDLLTDEEPVEKIMPSAELLMTSIERASDVTKKASADNLAAWQSEAKTAFNAAATTVQRLKETHEGYKEIEQKFAAIVASLEKHIGAVAADKPAGEVAGTTDEKGSSGEPVPTIPAIQLNF